MDLATSPARELSRLLETLWRFRALPRPQFEKLQRKANQLVGVVDKSAALWRAPFDLLVSSLEKEAELNALGQTFAYVQLSGLLRQRARARRLWHCQPEVLDTPIKRPVIVLGHMRSGTTRLQRLLGCDHRLAHTRFYEVMTPVRSRPDWRVSKSWLQLELLNAHNPGARAVHPTTATAVEEVFGLHSFSFYGAQIEAQWRVPTFAREWEAQDKQWVYGEFRHLLQTIAWQRGEAYRPWVLKAPQFMEDLAQLLDTFPDARLVCLHRDVAEVVASSASLVWNEMKLQSNAVDSHWIGAEWLRKTARRERICMQVRFGRPDVPQIDVDFAAMNRDWSRGMHRIYAFLDIQLTPDVERRMEGYLQAAERSGFRGHQYRAEDFGLSEDIARRTVGP